MADRTACDNVKIIASARMALYSAIESLHLSPDIKLTWVFITNSYINDRVEIALKAEDLKRNYIVREILTKHGNQSWIYKLPIKKTTGGYFYTHKFVYSDDQETNKKLQEAICNVIRSMLNIMDDFGESFRFYK